MPNRPTSTIAETQKLEIELSAALAENELLEESLADVQLALEDRGWLSMSIRAAEEFSPEGRRRAAALTRILVVQNPLIKRGVAIRTGYIWGQGVQVAGKTPEVNDVIQKFNEDNKSSFWSSQAREEKEKSLATDGAVFRALPTSPLTGRVRVRTIDPAEIQDIICNPEDRDEPWFYLRQYTANVAGARYAGITRPTTVTKRVLYPALGFRPTARMKTIDDIEVRWDTPVQHIAVNRIDGWLFGIGDAYAAIAWARAYKEFLEDWSKLTKALSRFAWKITSARKSTAQKAAETARSAAARLPAPESGAGATAVMAGSNLEAIPKSGATIDSESGKPLAGMIAAALGVPVTMLLSDPGSTGARAVAETLDEPTRHEMELRRSLWTDKDLELYDYVIDQAVKAPRGPLKGTVTLDEYGRELITLAGGDDRTVDISWPSLEKVAVDVIMKAIQIADDSGKIPPAVIARLTLMALGVDDIDEIMEKLVDDDGNWIDQTLNAGQAATDAFRRGENPAAVLR